MDLTRRREAAKSVACRAAEGVVGPGDGCAVLDLVCHVAEHIVSIVVCRHAVNGRGKDVAAIVGGVE